MTETEKIKRAINYCIAMIAPVSQDMKISDEDHEMLEYLYNRLHTENLCNAKDDEK